MLHRSRNTNHSKCQLSRRLAHWPPRCRCSFSAASFPPSGSALHLFPSLGSCSPLLKASARFCRARKAPSPHPAFVDKFALHTQSKLCEIKHSIDNLVPAACTARQTRQARQGGGTPDSDFSMPQTCNRPGLRRAAVQLPVSRVPVPRTNRSSCASSMYTTKAMLTGSENRSYRNRPDGSQAAGFPKKLCYSDCERMADKKKRCSGYLADLAQEPARGRMVGWSSVRETRLL
jgi:hypothetical protein